MTPRTDVAIIGAGPYGLSIAAHLRAAGISFRIFGSPMRTWREHMPKGMLLKSDGFASNLSDPAGKFTLAHFCEISGIPYDDTRVPVRLDTFTAYGQAFQQRLVPNLEERDVVKMEPDGEGYRLHLSGGGDALTHDVVVAVGISHFANVPPGLKDLPREFVSHSSQVKNPEQWQGRKITVVGAGASAIDIAVLLREARADVTLVARRSSLKFAGPPSANGRSLWDSIQHPSSPMGPGWRSRLYSDLPWLFRCLPAAMRLDIVKRYLGPAAGYPMKDRFIGKVETFLGHDIDGSEIQEGHVCLMLRGARGVQEHMTDHVVAATGYRVDLGRLPFLDPETLSQIRCFQHMPILSSSFESSAPGLYFVGMASMGSFGPVMRFACGAEWTARRITNDLITRASRRQRIPEPSSSESVRVTS